MADLPDTAANLQLRAATPADAAGINAIYNAYVRDTHITFDTEPWCLAQRQSWVCEFAPPYFAVVAVLDSQIAGFAYNDVFRSRAAYRFSTETSIYVSPDHARRRGLGRALYRELFARIATTELHRAYAVIALPNLASVAFHREFGFRPRATLSQVGWKFGKYWDTLWMERGL